jgi:23S rRNA (cytidine1920-2'-O)/16S rRNA (cytidine1409-2'-O)-methyltransferase
MQKVRVDLLLVERGLAESRSQAQRLVMAGQVRADGQVVTKPALTVAPETLLEVDHGPPFVSRGGEKLQAALATFDLDVRGLVCADVGASTGGFTDCLLQNGAQRVYAIDVGHGILHWKLRQDPRVVVMERTNARQVEMLSEAVSLVTIDASFISLKILLPVVRGWFPSEGGQAVSLVKPQFEAGRKQVARGSGVIRDPTVHRAVLLDILSFAQDQNYSIQGLIRSPLVGPKGNVEFLVWLSYPRTNGEHLEQLVDNALSASA